MKITRNALSWSSHATDLIKKRFLVGNDISREGWLKKIAENIASPNPIQTRRFLEKKYFSLIEMQKFFPTSSALHNAFNGYGSLSGCIVLPIPSEATEIFEKTLPDISRALVTGLGVGMDLSVLPPRFFPNSKSGRAHPGPIEVLRAVTSATSGIMQCGGVKLAAFMGSLSIHHPDIFSFIFLKTKERIQNANISVVHDLCFQRALIEGKLIPVYWTLDTGEKVCLRKSDIADMIKQSHQRSLPLPDLSVVSKDLLFSQTANRVVGKIENDLCFFYPEVILDCIAEAAHSCGDPGLLNLHAINQNNPTLPKNPEDGAHLGVGVLQTTTPCGEQPLLPYEVCHLGSINLSKFAEKGKFNFDKFKATVEIATRFMDDVVEVSQANIEEANKISKQNRKIGLGLMGFADALAELEIPYDSEKAFALADRIGFTLLSTAIKTSEVLAKEKGPFPSWPHSRLCREGSVPRRNATVTTIAPTGYISTLAGCSPSIEPYYLITYNRNAAGMRVQETEVLAKKLEKIGWSLEKWIEVTKQRNPKYEFDGSLQGLVSDPFQNEKSNNFLKKMKSVFKTSHEISPQDHLRMVTVFKKYIENGISKTINLPTTTTKEQVREILIKSIEWDLKGITVFRDKCLEVQALTAPKAIECCPSCKSSTFLEKNGCGGYSCSSAKGGCGYESGSCSL